MLSKLVKKPRRPKLIKLTRNNYLKTECSSSGLKLSELSAVNSVASGFIKIKAVTT